MFEILGTLLTSVVSGGATGLIGVLIQRWFDLKTKDRDIQIIELNHENALALARIESERAMMRANADMYIAQEDKEARETEADSRSLVASFENDKAAYLEKGAQLKKGRLAGVITFMMALVDFTRGILRPGMTIYLCGLVTVMFFWVRELADIHGVKLSAEQIMELIVQIIATILYCTITSTVWWFGSRPPKKFGDA